MSDFEPHHIEPVSRNPGFVSPLSVSAHAGNLTPTLPRQTGSAGKRRRASKAKASPILKRAVSTPQMGALDGHDSSSSRALSPSALDKRRNKLGYQRISIACGHCRRRKIRCVLADADEMGRCQNCIRLKKECVFYPVDSAGGAESRAHQNKSAGSKASSVVSASPSERKPGGIMDGERDYPRFPPLASNAPSDLAPISSESGLGISIGTSMTTPEYGFDPTVSAREGWPSGVFQQADSTNSDASTAGSWRVQDSPRGGAFPTPDGHSGALYPGYHYPPPRGEYGMQPPMRSMSYGNIEPSIGTFQPSASANPIEFTRQGPAAHYTLPPAAANHTPTTSLMTDAAIAPVATDSMPQFGLYSPQWSYYQQPPPHSVSMDFPRHDSVSMQQWYSQHGQMGQGMGEQSGQQQQDAQQQPHWQQNQLLMPPPGPGYGKGHHSLG